MPVVSHQQKKKGPTEKTWFSFRSLKIALRDFLHLMFKPKDAL